MNKTGNLYGEFDQMKKYVVFVVRGNSMDDLR